MITYRFLSIFYIFLFLASCGQQTIDIRSDRIINDSPNTILGANEFQDGINIGTFNLLRLGQHQDKDLDRTAELIIQSKLDILGATEIMEAAAAQDLLDHLNENDRTNSWDMVLSDNASGETHYKEYFAYYYKTEKIQPVDYNDDICDSNHATDSQGVACYAKDTRKNNMPNFDRDPFIGMFEVEGETIVLVTAHLYYGSNDEQEALKRRQREMNAFRGVMNAIQTYDSEYHVIGLGDFNLEMREPSSIERGINEDGRFIPEIPESFFDNGPELQVLISSDTTIGKKNYDHIIYFKNNPLKHTPNSDKAITDFTINNREQKTLFKQEVSDHYPVTANFQVLH